MLNHSASESLSVQDPASILSNWLFPFLNIECTVVLEDSLQPVVVDAALVFNWGTKISIMISETPDNLVDVLCIQEKVFGSEEAQQTEDFVEVFVVTVNRCGYRITFMSNHIQNQAFLRNISTTQEQTKACQSLKVVLLVKERFLNRFSLNYLPQNRIRVA